MVRINRLTAEEWLRLLREQQLSNVQVLYCATCEEAEASTSVLTCERCHTPMTALDESFWRKVSNKLRRSYQRDHGLFARVKGEHPKWPFPQLKAPLDWVAKEFGRARRLRGKPSEIEKRLFVVSWLRALSQPYFSIAVGDVITRDLGNHEAILILSTLSKDGSEVVVTSDIPTHHLRIVEHPPCMSVTLALSVLFDEEPEFSTPGFRALRRKHAKFSEKELRELGKQFRETFSQRFGDLPAGNRREIERVIRWARRLAYEPIFRISGEKPRVRVSKHQPGVKGNR